MANQFYDIKGDRAFGDRVVLAALHDDLVAHVPWRSQGYTIAPFLEEQPYLLLKKGLENLLYRALELVGLQIPRHFNPVHYHHLVNEPKLHLQVIKHTKAIDYRHFPLPAEQLAARISEVVQIPLTTKNPNTEENIFHLRIVRPQSSDFNPLHRDAWLDELRGSINLYVPLAGSTAQSSLYLVPGSHYWPESDVERTLAGAVMNGAQYNVPGLTATKQPLHLIRPNPVENEVMVFSPYLIHGGSANNNPDETRISLEVRLWRKS